MGISGKLLSRDKLYHSVLTQQTLHYTHQEKWVFTNKNVPLSVEAYRRIGDLDWKDVKIFLAVPTGFL